MAEDTFVKSLFRISALSAAILMASSAQSSAGVLFTLHDVRLAVGQGVFAGDLTGTFTLSDDLKKLEAAEITSSADKTNGHSTFHSTAYTKGEAVYVYDAQLPNNFQLWLGTGDQLKLSFTKALDVAGKVYFHADSFEWQGGPMRYVSEGWVSAVPDGPGAPGAVPEPSSIAMATIAMGAAGLLARRRRATA